MADEGRNDGNRVGGEMKGFRTDDGTSRATMRASLNCPFKLGTVQEGGGEMGFPFARKELGCPLLDVDWVCARRVAREPMLERHANCDSQVKCAHPSPSQPGEMWFPAPCAACVFCCVCVVLYLCCVVSRGKW
jgi:hypothetical protein